MDETRKTELSPAMTALVNGALFGIANMMRIIGKEITDDLEYGRLAATAAFFIREAEKYLPADAPRLSQVGIEVPDGIQMTVGLAELHDIIKRTAGE